MFWIETAGSLTAEVLSLLERMVENVSFALGIFEREHVRRHSEQAHRRVSDMFAALSATNTAILRSRSRQEMFDRVCEAVANSGKSLRAAAILVEHPLTHDLEAVSTAGRGIDLVREVPLSTDPDHPRGQGLAGPAFREQKLKISSQLQPGQKTKGDGVRSEAAPVMAARPRL